MFNTGLFKQKTCFTQMYTNDIYIKHLRLTIRICDIVGSAQPESDQTYHVSQGVTMN